METAGPFPTVSVKQLKAPEERQGRLQDHRPFSVTSEDYWAPEHQGTGYFTRSDCIKPVCLCHYLHTLSATCALVLSLMFARGTCALCMKL